ncbi:GyrI-like domain-containing protein [Clostridium tagluense]|uniref:GyrI-like domain-containing protein n=1 Tax=Clostridium tagluense TaxID=360422 RepID=UPI001CF0FEDE|nr:GyrI-like domain-containing protein [Clostridium tagluense]MCB2312595.1 GyrI-like domain-containing protein [Clostridium tagluense]MCB2317271.1 GyrI-like domain-containing protein [Clostridium tagluense]MCB2322138.1 GyrI-like domain-containing protein [Clostridium tagluense]MCB2327067.1 GyrI-like domain-containing protein [Clostridium tagluense]MCB2331785.1 GyrI-like domain-containing protein [Clostridium tagluense]
MEAKIVSIKGFKAVGIPYFGNNSNGEIATLWEAFNKNYKDIKQKSKSMLCYGICDCGMDSEGRFQYTACIEVDSFLDVPEGMVTKVVPEGRHLVYTYRGAIKDLGEFYTNIFTKLLPASGYEIEYRPQLELYDERFMNNGEFDIYIPIK